MAGSNLSCCIEDRLDNATVSLKDYNPEKVETKFNIPNPANKENVVPEKSSFTGPWPVPT